MVFHPETIDLDMLERAVRNEMPGEAALILQLIERCRVAESKLAAKRSWWEA